MSPLTKPTFHVLTGRLRAMWKPYLYLCQTIACARVLTLSTHPALCGQGLVCSTPSRTMSSLTRHMRFRKHTWHNAVKVACCCLTVTFNMSVSHNSHFLCLLYLSFLNVWKAPSQVDVTNSLCQHSAYTKLKPSNLWQACKKQKKKKNTVLPRKTL